ncbi:hypothetical protein LAG90_06035 [Marinilongibacter aquaticus]|uniref:hypothetical protein n=1 Tax=Marinilongibacter aquaticus TaxID=2975157 RepID=UPI0021BD16D0|nr:hypothetical protein [Marinilongibacter aquaticus]UBM60201.1 hypothetical protein LAG90_06035 [Marinilongibacter aquaticus]
MRGSNFHLNWVQNLRQSGVFDAYAAHLLKIGNFRKMYAQPQLLVEMEGGLGRGFFYPG